jgi:hypothetical protein
MNYPGLVAPRERWWRIEGRWRIEGFWWNIEDSFLDLIFWRCNEARMN